MDFSDRIGKKSISSFLKNQTNLAHSIILNKILQETLITPITTEGENTCETLEIEGEKKQKPAGNIWVQPSSIYKAICPFLYI